MRDEAFPQVLAAAQAPVDWAYEVWDELKDLLRTGDNHQRTIAVQVLCKLAQSDPQGRMLRDFAALLAVTKDKRFATARHSLQALWQVGVAGPQQQKLVLDALSKRFADCGPEKHGPLLRCDILAGLRKLYEAVQQEQVRRTALALIAMEAAPND